MDGLLLDKARRTRKLSLQHIFMQRLPRVVWEDEELAQHMLHLSLEYCSLVDGGLPRFNLLDKVISHSLSLSQVLCCLVLTDAPCPAVQSVAVAAARDNNLTEVPEGISSLSHLTFLTLNNNYIRVLPAELLALSKLHCLILSFNKIVRYPS